MMSRQEINALVDEKIRAHEIRIGIISGIAGMIFLAALFSALVFLYFVASS
jgi:hypothetical protein